MAIINYDDLVVLHCAAYHIVVVKAKYVMCLSKLINDYYYLGNYSSLAIEHIDMLRQYIYIDNQCIYYSITSALHLQPMLYTWYITFKWSNKEEFNNSAIL